MPSAYRRANAPASRKRFGAFAVSAAAADGNWSVWAAKAPWPDPKFKYVIDIVVRNETRNTRGHEMQHAVESRTMVMGSGPMAAVIARLSKVAGLDTTVLLTGESGTGK